MTQDKSRAWLSGMGPFHDRSLIEAELTTRWKFRWMGECHGLRET